MDLHADRQLRFDGGKLLDNPFADFDNIGAIDLRHADRHCRVAIMAYQPVRLLRLAQLQRRDVGQADHCRRPCPADDEILNAAEVVKGGSRHEANAFVT